MGSWMDLPGIAIIRSALSTCIDVGGECHAGWKGARSRLSFPGPVAVVGDGAGVVVAGNLIVLRVRASGIILWVAF